MDDFANIGDSISQATGFASAQSSNDSSNEFHVTISGLPKSNNVYAAQDIAAEQKYGLPSGTLNAISAIESNHNPNAINKNKNGTIDSGRFQVNSTNPNIDGNDPDQVAGFVSNLLKKSGGDVNKAIAMYHVGPNGDLGGTEAQNYVAKFNNILGTSNPQPSENTSNVYKPSQFIDANAITDAVNGGGAYQISANDQQAQPKNQLEQQYDQLKKDVSSLSPRDVLENSSSGALEVGAQMLTGAGASAIGGLHGLYDLATGKGVDTAVKDIHQAQENYTYQPRTKSGKILSDVANIPFAAAKEGASEAGSAIGEVIGGNQGRLIGESLGNIAPDVAVTLLGGRAALNGIKPTELPQQVRIEPSFNEQMPFSFGADNVGAARVANPDIGATLAPEKAIPPTATNSAPISDSAQIAQRQEVLSRIPGLDSVRKSALTGDPMAAATEYQLGKFDEPAGAAAKEQFANEKTALENQASNLAQNNKTPLGMDLDSRAERGHVIMDALDNIRQDIDNQWKSLYKQADAESEATGQKIQPTNLNNFIGGDKADFLGTTEGEALLRGSTARMKSLGMIDAEGNSQPVTVKQAEQLKQYLNNQWQPRTNRLIRNMKDAIDEDVISSGSPDLYSAARQLRAQKSAIFDNPNGISKIMESDGPNGINRRVPYEDVANTIANMPTDQMSHILSILKSSPESQEAIGAIQNHFVSKLTDAGTKTSGGKPLEVWNAPNVNQYINQNNGKLSAIFNEDQINKIADLRDAGNILSVNTSYPGAAAQATNAMKQGMMSQLLERGSTLAGGGVGSMVGAPVVGAMAGQAIGKAMGSKLGETRALSKFKSGTTKISEFKP